MGKDKKKIVRKTKKKTVKGDTSKDKKIEDMKRPSHSDDDSAAEEIDDVIPQPTTSSELNPTDIVSNNSDSESENQADGDESPTQEADSVPENDASAPETVLDHNDDDLDSGEPAKKKKKEKTPGIIYLSSIPDEMQYPDVLKVFSELGEVGRISLQIGGPQPHHSRKKRYAEGWVEYLDKKKAKRVVALLNNQLVGGRKKSKWYDCIWHMKYLPRFQWSHLSERLAYEQASTQQRMRSEITQARKEAQHFAEQIEWKQKELKMANKHADWKSNKRKYEYTQRVTDDEILKRKAGSKRVAELEKSRSNVLGSLFGKKSKGD